MTLSEIYLSLSVDSTIANPQLAREFYALTWPVFLPFSLLFVPPFFVSFPPFLGLCVDPVHRTLVSVDR